MGWMRKAKIKGTTVKPQSGGKKLTSREKKKIMAREWICCKDWAAGFYGPQVFWRFCVSCN
jgi:hypothetical protein